MPRGRLINLIVVGLLILAAIIVLTSPSSPLAPWLSPVDYDNTTVTAVEDNGTPIQTFSVRVADTEHEKFIGLSETQSLGKNDGMLFVHDTPDTYTYVMRDMSFPIDIIFIDENGTITSIHHAPLPADSPTKYRGQGQFVLEINYGRTNETGIDVGDRIAIPDSVAR